jgi:hypothetical protein
MPGLNRLTMLDLHTRRLFGQLARALTDNVFSKFPNRVLLAPQTSGPRDVPRCGALSLKVASRQGDSAEIAATLNVKFWYSVTAIPGFWNNRAQSSF